MKGKYAAKASLRREDSGVRSEIESYQHHVKRLTDENGQLRDELAKSRDDFRQETNRLRALLDEGLSPELTAVRSELEHQRDRADEAGRRAAAIRRKQEALIGAISVWLHDATGCTGLEITEKLVSLMDGEEHTIVGIGADKAAVSSGSRTVRALQQSRGYRSSKPDRLEKLDALIKQARAGVQS